MKLLFSSAVDTMAALDADSQACAEVQSVANPVTEQVEAAEDDLDMLASRALEHVDARGGQENPLVRADMAFYPTPNNGGVFSASSIAWAGSLSHNNYKNNVSRITKNVLDRFVSRKPLLD